MARPKKIGLDYFPVDVYFDDKIQSFELLHGNDGFAWLIKFWQSAYKTEFGEVNLNGLFGNCSAKNARITTEQQQEYLNTCKELELLYQTETGLWTSNGIKKRISTVSKERQDAIKRKLKDSKKKVKESKGNPPLFGEQFPNNVSGCDGIGKKEKKGGNHVKIPEQFLSFLKIYPGSKSKTNDWTNFFKKYRSEMDEIFPLLIHAVEKEIAHKKKTLDLTGRSIPWKHMSTWINNRCWEQELDEPIPNMEPIKVKESTSEKMERLLKIEQEAKGEPNETDIQF